MRTWLLVSAAVVAVGAGVLPATADSGDPVVPGIQSLRVQAATRDGWLHRRFDTVLPALMEREGIDMWLLVAREYNEDPVVTTMLPATWLSARRRTILVFHQPAPGQPVERLSVTYHVVRSRDAQEADRGAPELYRDVWTPREQPDQWARLREVVAERRPRRIAVNRSPTFPLADGLSASEEKALVVALGEPYASRMVSGERLALGWLETRIPEEMAAYRVIQRVAHAIVMEGLSERVITPGVTRASAVQWWYRERIRELGLETWFHPSVSVDRADTGGAAPAGPGTDPVIVPGDLLHVDFGIKYLGFTTDTQNHAYVLRPGETEAPEGLRAGLAAVNRLQDILMANFRAGEPANALLARARAQAVAEGLSPTIYSHALGYHGHGAGPWIGSTDNQEGIAGLGDYPTYPNTAWSIELSVAHAVPEWGGRAVRFRLEEDAYFDGETMTFIDGRQEQLHLIPRPR